jgi:hypothetical protein
MHTQRRPRHDQGQGQWQGDHRKKPRAPGSARKRRAGHQRPFGLRGEARSCIGATHSGGPSCVEGTGHRAGGEKEAEGGVDEQEVSEVTEREGRARGRERSRDRDVTQSLLSADEGPLTTERRTKLSHQQDGEERETESQRAFVHPLACSGGEGPCKRGPVPHQAPRDAIAPGISAGDTVTDGGRASFLPRLLTKREPSGMATSAGGPWSRKRMS